MSRRKNKKGMSFHQDQYWQTAAYNQSLFFSFRDRIVSLALSRFKWLNLPDTCNERYLEWSLLTEGSATIAFPKKQPGIFYSTRAVWQGAPNVYDNPRRWRSVGNNGWNFTVNSTNGVFIWDNKTRYPLMQQIDIWARELVDVMRTKQMNRMHQRIPFILTGPQEKYYDMVNLYKQVAGGEPAIITTEGISTIDVQALQTGVSYLGEELQAEMINIWAQIYALMGIPNLPFKAERQIQDEVANLAAPTELAFLDPLGCRREACEKLNTRFEKYLEKPIQVVKNVDFESANYAFEHKITDQVAQGTKYADLLEAKRGVEDEQ